MAYYLSKIAIKKDFFLSNAQSIKDGFKVCFLT